MILGDTCTRRCGFCNVKTGKPTWNDPLEPPRVARSVAKMGLRHAVITSVDRDDLPDYGASAFVGVIRSIRRQAPDCKVEVPDARLPRRGDAARARSSPSAPTSSTTTSRSCRGCTRSPAAARAGSARCACCATPRRWAATRSSTKSGLMVGLGETHDEMVEAFGDAARARRPGPHRRPVPAPDRAPPAGRALLAPGRVQGARGRRLRRSASSTSPPARSCARATTPTSTSRRTGPASGPLAAARAGADRSTVFPLKDNIPTRRVPGRHGRADRRSTCSSTSSGSSGGITLGDPSSRTTSDNLVDYAAIPYEVTHPGQHCRSPTASASCARPADGRRRPG